MTGFFLLDLAGILLSSSASMLGTGQLPWRVAFVCVGVALIAGLLVRSRPDQPPFVGASVVGTADEGREDPMQLYRAKFLKLGPVSGAWLALPFGASACTGACEG